MFRFPHDPVLRARWIKNLHREKEYVPNKDSRVCHLHFLPEDLTYQSIDTKQSRKKVRQGPTKYLKHRPGAYPRIHENLPSYLSLLPGKSRRTTASSEARIANENSEIRRQIEQLEEEDSVSFDDLLSYVPQVTGFQVLVQDIEVGSKQVTFLQLKMNPPTILSTLEILETMEFAVSLRGSTVNKKYVKHLISTNSDRISKYSEINNILAELKSWTDCASGMLVLHVNI